MRGPLTFAAIALSLVVGAAGAQAQAPPSQPHQHAAVAPAAPRQAAAPAVHDHGAAPVELTALLAKMDAAKGDAKMAVMSDIIKQLVAERTARQEAPAAESAPGGQAMECAHCAAMMKGGMKMDQPMKMDHK